MFNLFRKKSKVILDDHVFGLIEFESKHGSNIWTHIPTISDSFMIVIEAPEEGPSELQRDFFIALRDNLKEKELECEEFISIQQLPPLGLSDMTVYSVEIGPEEEINKEEFVIELSDGEADEIHRVEFRNGKAVNYEIDD